MIYIRAYRATDEPLTCKEYIKGHVQVLKDYGIESITSNTNSWVSNPNMYCFIATDEDGELVGGIRIQVADGIHSLPVEEAVGKMDPGIYELVRDYAINGGVGELCGLWNSNKVKGIGVSVILVRAAISSINQLKFQTLTGICAGYSLKMFQNVGFVINQELGDHGNFIYPNENYLAHVVGILNGITLSTAALYDKEKMLHLRSKPIQFTLEKGSKCNFEVGYDLIINNVTKIKFPESFILEKELVF
ncbi:MAG TPA: hypothetical protein VN026_01840 [Bacteroidia bacterium]|jgi:hypothetical protein|nr:hypothetical protein [Bacteroidia bacterium]